MRGTTSHQPYRLLTHRPGHDLELGLMDQAGLMQESPIGGSDTSLDHRPEHRRSPIRQSPVYQELHSFR
jgi:hypothetical protein